jgi:hypothetical protein
VTPDSARSGLARALGDFWYWGSGPTHADIDRVFDSLELLDSLDPGGKRERVEQAVLNSEPDQLPRLLFELVELLDEQGFLVESEENPKRLALLRRRLAPYGIGFDESGVTTASLGVETSQLLDAAALRDHVNRIHRAVDDGDSQLVLGSAKELLESTAKFVLHERGIEAPAKFPALMSEALSSIGLHAKAIDGDDQLAAATRRILGALNQIAVGVNELRNDHGTGHGRAVGAKFSLRHARLAAGSATVLATIMIDTLEDPKAPWRSRS